MLCVTRTTGALASSVTEEAVDILAPLLLLLVGGGEVTTADGLLCWQPMVDGAEVCLRLDRTQ